MSKTVTAGVAILCHSSYGSNDDCIGKSDSAHTPDWELHPFGPPVRQSVRCLPSEQEGEWFEWRSGLLGKAHPCPLSTGVGLSPFHGGQHGMPLHLLSFSILTCASMSFLLLLLLFLTSDSNPYLGFHVLRRMNRCYQQSSPSVIVSQDLLLSPYRLEPPFSPQSLPSVELNHLHLGRWILLPLYRLLFKSLSWASQTLSASPSLLLQSLPLSVSPSAA